MSRSVLGDIPVWGSPSQIAHAKLQQATIDRLSAALAVIARGSVPPQKEGHYLAHREAVRLAREALKPATTPACAADGSIGPGMTKNPSGTPQ